MSEKKSVVNGDQVDVHFSVTLQDGTPVQSSEPTKPLRFVAGTQEVLEPISKAVIGMSPGETKELILPPERAFGMRDEHLRTEVPRSQVPRDAKEGDRLTDPKTQETWTVRELKHDVVVVDGNHPLAGHTLVFELELAAVR